MKTRNILFTAAIILFLFPPAAAFSFSCECVSVADGDTITILCGEGANKIHLYGIDAPERGQDFSRKAKSFLSDLVYKKVIQVEPEDIDRYGHTVGIVFADDLNVNREIVKAGLAWVYRKYCIKPFCAEWLELEDAARKAGIGLWRHKEPIPPWEFRRRNR